MHIISTSKVTHLNPTASPSRFPFIIAAKIPTKLRRGDRAKVQAEFHDAMRTVLLFRFLAYLMLEVANLAIIVSQVLR